MRGEGGGGGGKKPLLNLNKLGEKLRPTIMLRNFVDKS